MDNFDLRKYLAEGRLFENKPYDDFLIARINVDFDYDSSKRWDDEVVDYFYSQLGNLGNTNNFIGGDSRTDLETGVKYTEEAYKAPISNLSVVDKAIEATEKKFKKESEIKELFVSILTTKESEEEIRELFPYLDEFEEDES